MLEGPPREKQCLSWLYVVIWTLIIFVNIPLARTFQRFVAHYWGRDLFTYAVLSAIVIALIVALLYVIRHRSTFLGSYLWLLVIATIFIAYTIELGKKNPEESIHFIQYGVLGVFVYRALTHQFQDFRIYFAAATICAVIGTSDEIIQWITPDRYWDLRDIWINFFGASLIQIAIAKGLKPKFIRRRPRSSTSALIIF
jgi:uncharacterized membrane protein